MDGTGPEKSQARRVAVVAVACGRSEARPRPCSSCGSVHKASGIASVHAEKQDASKDDGSSGGSTSASLPVCVANSMNQ